MWEILYGSTVDYTTAETFKDAILIAWNVKVIFLNYSKGLFFNVIWHQKLLMIDYLFIFKNKTLTKIKSLYIYE